MPRHTLVIATTLSAALLLGAGRAGAQPAPWQPEPRNAGWSITPGLGVGLFHDSNVSLGTNRPGSGDLVALVHPRGELDFVGRRTRFTAGYAGALQAFRDNDALNRYQQRGRIGSSRVLSPRMSIRGEGSLLVSPTTEEVEDGTIPFAAVGLRSTGASAAIDSALTRRVSITGTWRYHRLQYDEVPELVPELALLRGGWAHTPGVGVRYELTPRHGLDADWSYTYGQVDSVVGAFDLQQAGAGWRYRLREHTTVGVGGGATLVSAPAVDLSGWYPSARASLEQQAGPNTLSVQYSYAVVPAFSHGGLSQQQRIGAGVRVPFLAGRTYLTGSVALSHNEALDEIGHGLNARTLWLQGAFGYHVARWLRTEGFVHGARQRALDHDAAAVQRMRIGVQFVTTRPMRID